MIIANAVSPLEIIGAIACSAIFAGIIGWIVQWCVDEYRRLSIEEEEENLELFMDIVDDFEDEPETFEPILLSGEPLIIGDHAYDTITSEIVMYCGKDEDGNAVGIHTDFETVVVTRHNETNLIKVAE